MTDPMKLHRSLVLLLSLLSLTACSGPETGTTSANDALAILDTNRDGVLDPFELLDVLLVVEQEIGHPPTFEELAAYASNLEGEHEEEMAELLGEFDDDGDGIVRISQVDEEEAGFLRAMDRNGDGGVDLAEATTFDFAADALASEAEIQQRVEKVFRSKDGNGNGVVDLPDEVEAAELGRFVELDLDRDGRVTTEEATTFWVADNVPVRFDVEGDVARMTGVITAALPAAVLRLLFDHPEVETIEMDIVPGSIDDQANLRAALYVHEHGLTTRLTGTSTIASGGTDFFLGGARRVVEPGAILGVHSWGGGPTPATEVPRDDPAHQIYLDFYEAVDVPTDFYWYTLEAAPAEGMHIMTEDELVRYEVRREGGQAGRE